MQIDDITKELKKVSDEMVITREKFQKLSNRRAVLISEMTAIEDKQTELSL